MKLRTAFGLTALTMLSAACALIIDLPSSVSVAEEAGVPPPIPLPEAAPESLCPTPIRLRSFNATDSLTVADVALPVYLGALDYLREINEGGGIRGCLLDYAFKQVVFGDQTSAVTAYEQFKAEPEWPEVAALFGVSSADTIALGPKVEEDRKVLFSVAYNGTAASPVPKTTQVKVPETSTTFAETMLDTQIDTPGFPYVFFPGTDYSTAIRIAMYHISTLQPGARVGFVHCAFNEFCLNPLNAGKTFAAQSGLSVGRSLLAELTDRDAKYGAAVTAYFAAEAAHKLMTPGYKPVTWLWAGNLTSGTFFLAAALGQLGATTTPPSGSNIPQPVWDEARILMNATRIITNNYGFDESLVSLCARLGVGSATCGRVFGIMSFLAFGDTSTAAPAMTKLVELHDKWRARDANVEYVDRAALADAGIPIPTTRSVRYVQGHMNVQLLRAAIEKVLDAKKRVTGETLKEALESFRSLDTGGLTAPLSFTPEDHRPQASLSIYRVDPPVDAGDASTPGRLENVSSNRRITLQGQWLGW